MMQSTSRHGGRTLLHGNNIHTPKQDITNSKPHQMCNQQDITNSNSSSSSKEDIMVAPWYIQVQIHIPPVVIAVIISSSSRADIMGDIIGEKVY